MDARHDARSDESEGVRSESTRSGQESGVQDEQAASPDISPDASIEDVLEVEPEVFDEAGADEAGVTDADDVILVSAEPESAESANSRARAGGTAPRPRT